MNNKASEKVLVALLSFKRTVGVVAILVVMLAIPITLVLNQQSQSLQQNAAFEPTSTPTPTLLQTPPINIDVTGDGRIDNNDYLMIIICMNNSPQCKMQMIDLNGDGIVTQADYQILLDKYLQTQPR